MARKIIVLGGSGMLGTMLTDVLSRDSELEVTSTAREPDLLERGRRAYRGVNWVLFDATRADSLNVMAGNEWVVNAIGITKPLIRDDNAFEIERALRVNSLFPHALAAKAREVGARVLQIATDCVYSGAKGGYVENDLHDALDVYGKTKSLGETVLRHVHNLRCSIIGPEPKDFKFLVEWFVRQPAGAQVNGFTNHRWNGVSTYHFGRVAQGIIKSGLELPNVQHLVPSGDVTKAEMLEAFAASYNRKDVTIRSVAAEKVIDRTLETKQPDVNRELWRLAGYETPPTIPEMIAEMAQNPNRFATDTAVARAR
jgi:dTDP-4-dehydrorhamnose reductase